MSKKPKIAHLPNSGKRSTRGAREGPNMTNMIQTGRVTGIKQNDEPTDHIIHPRVAQILERGVTNYHNRHFLQSLHSTVKQCRCQREEANRTT